MSPKTISLFIVTIGCLTYSTNCIDFIPTHLKHEYGEALEAIFTMGVRLEALLHTNNSTPDNFLISPLSVTILLGQLMLGAEGKFQEQLYELVSLPETSPSLVHTLPPTLTSPTSSSSASASQESLDNRYTNLHLQLGKLVHDLRKDPKKKRNFTLESANALFLNKNLRLRPSFQHETEFLYDTQIMPLNFKKPNEALLTINKWASDHTNGLIRRILTSPPTPQTAGIFANALYFYGKWEQPFSSELNSRAPFSISSTKSVQTDFMTGFMEQVPYVESKRLNCKLLVLPYEKAELGMYIILPNVGHPHEYNIKAFASEARFTDFLELLGDLRNRDVVVKIPKLSLTSSLSLLRPLQQYATYKRVQSLKKQKAEYTDRITMPGSTPGNAWDILEDKLTRFQNFSAVNQNFDDVVLNAASANGDLLVSDIFQQISFSVNEIGTEAAAVTAGIIDYSGGSKSFLANKPFMFFIRHEATAATLFWGTIANPSV